MFDFSKALQDAQKVTEESSSGAKFQYKLIYPGEGTLSFRILINPKSNSIIRKIVRHTIGNNRIPCLTTYGMNRSDCPICQAADTVYNTNGSVPKGMWAQARGLCFIQYISSTYTIEGIKPGDIALLMVPKTLYESIQEWIVSITQGDQGMSAMMAVFCGHECMEQSINRDANNKYSFMMNPFKKFKSANSDEEFNKILDSLPDLNEQMIPATANDEVMSTIKAAVENIDQTYINPKVATPNVTPTIPTTISPSANVGTDSPVNVEGASSANVVPDAVQSSTPAPTVKPKPCYGTYNKLQTGSDPVSMALKGLCGTCQYVEDCKKYEG